MRRVLLLEPDRLLAKLYSRMLEHRGYVVSCASNGQEAVYAADDAQPDVVILELQLPGHSGIEFLYEFRSYADWQTLPIILHTLVPVRALAAYQTQLETLSIGKHLYKPTTSLERLLQAVDRALIVEVT